MCEQLEIRAPVVVRVVSCEAVVVRVAFQRVVRSIGASIVFLVAG